MTNRNKFKALVLNTYLEALNKATDECMLEFKKLPKNLREKLNSEDDENMEDISDAISILKDRLDRSLTRFKK